MFLFIHVIIQGQNKTKSKTNQATEARNYMMTLQVTLSVSER